MKRKYFTLKLIAFLIFCSAYNFSFAQNCSAVLGVTNIEKVHLTSTFSEDFERAISKVDGSSNNTNMQSGGSITLLIDGAPTPISGFLNLSHSEADQHSYTEQIRDLLTRSNTKDVYISQSAPGVIDAWKYCISATVNPIALDGINLKNQYSMTLTAPDFMIPRKITKVTYLSAGQNLKVDRQIIGRKIGGQNPEINFFIPITQDTGFFCLVEFDRGKSVKFFSVSPPASNVYGNLDATVLQHGGASKNLRPISLDFPFVIQNGGGHKALPPSTKVLLKGEIEVDASSFLDKNGDIKLSVVDLNSIASSVPKTWGSPAWTIDQHQTIHKNLFSFIMVAETNSNGELNLQFNVQIWNVPNADANWQIGPNSNIEVFKY